jgi:hypothetical protein
MDSERWCIITVLLRAQPAHYRRERGRSREIVAERSEADDCANEPFLPYPETSIFRLIETFESHFQVRLFNPDAIAHSSPHSGNLLYSTDSTISDVLFIARSK